MAATSTARPKPGLGSVAAAYRLGLTTVAPPARWIASLAGIAGIMILQLLIVRSSDLADERAVEVAAFSLILFIVPIFCVSNASNAFGSAVNDDTLVYPWLRPAPRWHLALGFTAAVWTLMLTAVAVSALVLFPFGAPADLVLGLAVGGGLGAIAYSAVFTGLGVRFKRASSIGLVYVVLVDTFFSQANQAMARISIRNYAGSVMAAVADESAGRFGVDPPLAVIILGLFTVAGIALTTVLLKRASVA